MLILKLTDNSKPYFSGSWWSGISAQSLCLINFPFPILFCKIQLLDTFFRSIYFQKCVSARYAHYTLQPGLHRHTAPMKFIQEWLNNDFQLCYRYLVFIIFIGLTWQSVCLLLQDVWSDSEGHVSLDSQQDYELIEAKHTPGRFYLLFKRRFNTCDPRDYLIEVCVCVWGGGGGWGGGIVSNTNW